MLHSSIYNIYVKKVETNKHIIAHGYTGVIDVVNNEILEIVFSDTINENKINEEMKSILIGRGYLTEQNSSEELDHLNLLANTLNSKENSQNAFIILVTYDCNFRCSYCFENKISDGNLNSKRVSITKELVEAAFKAILKLTKVNLPSKQIILYGGEPLLAENYRIIEYIVSLGKENGFAFKAITNGYDLDKFKDLLGVGEIEEIQITIDGTEIIHNQRRIHYKGYNTFAKIVSNIKLAVGCGTKVNVRINIDKENFNEIKEIANYFNKEGLLQKDSLFFYTTILNCNDDEISCHGSKLKREMNSNLTNIKIQKPQLTISTKENRGIKKTKDHLLTRDLLMQRFNSEMLLNPEMKYVHCLDYSLKKRLKQKIINKNKKLFPFRSTFCAAQDGMYIFDPFGTIYPCFELVGNYKYKIGEYSNGELNIYDELSKWTTKNVSNVKGCNRCKYALFCGGGCTAHSVLAGKDHNSPNCEGFPAIFKQVVYEIYKEFT